MRLLIIDDDAAERESVRAFLAECYGSCEVVFVDNLLDFDELLFHSNSEYDGVIIDAQLEWPYDRVIIDAQLEWESAYTDDVIKEFLSTVGLQSDDKSDVGELLGWRYFDQYMRKQRNFDISKVLIKTGFASSIRRSTDKDRLDGVNILSKGDPNYTKKFKEFLNGKWK